MAQFILFFVLCCMAGAGCSEQRPVTLEEFGTRVVTLPDGQRIRAEVMMRPEDMMRGMMFRDSLAPNRGMLFIHDRPGEYTYWMYQVRIPLDIIWMDKNRRIVEMSPNTPPCKTKASQCPSYGGHKEAMMVLELAAGSIEKHHLRVGDVLDF
jgi:uncharacterized membrane protein (UPF0127 family)